MFTLKESAGIKARMMAEQLHEERQKNIELQAEVTRLRKKSGTVQKYMSLKVDFKALYEQYEKSEAMRADQKDLIDTLRKQIARMRKNTTKSDQSVSSAEVKDVKAKLKFRSSSRKKLAKTNNR